MSGRRARFTMAEVLTLIRAAQKEGARLVIELDEDGKFRVVVNEIQEPVAPSHKVVL